MDLGYTEEDGEVVVWLVGRDSDGHRHPVSILGTEPYAFVPEPYDIPNEDYVVRVEEGFEGHDGTPLRKVTVKLPRHINTRSNRPCLTDHIPKEDLYEGDIPYPRRVGVDYGLSGYIRVPKGKEIHIDDVETDIDPSDVPNIEPRVMMADIEAMPPDLSGNKDFDDFVDNAEEPITAMTLYDTYSEEYLSLVLDREDLVEGKEIRRYLEDHWDDTGFEEQFVQADIRLIQCEDEESLLESFIKEVEDKRPDLLSGWNWVGFDHKYIVNRLKREEFKSITEHRMSDIGTVGGYKVAQLIDGLPGFDMMDSYCGTMTFHNWRSKSLDYVSNEVLGIGKVEDMNIRREYRENRSRFLAYNIIDTQLLVAMDELNGIHEFFYQLADLSSVQIYDTHSEMRLVDGFVMSHRNDDEILPSATEKDLGKIDGGLVLTPSDGIEEWVATFDLKSLYPSIYITLNISEETLTKENSHAFHVKGEDNEINMEIEENPDGPDLVCPAMPANEEDVGGEITEEHIDWSLNQPVAMGTHTDHEGLLPKYLKLLFEERERFKTKRNEHAPDSPEYSVFDNKQNAIKVVMNSFYGVSQNDYYRLSTPLEGDDGIGSTITAGGRYVLWRGAQIMRDMGYEVKYGDTDSVLIQLATDDEDVTPYEVYLRGLEVEERLNEMMDEVADEFGVGDEHPFLKDADLHGNDRHCLHWEFEKLYRRFLQAGKKKRYAGLPVWKEGKWFIDEPKSREFSIEDVDPDITGFESKRSDIPDIAADIQEEIIEQVLGGKDFEGLSEYITNQIEAIKNLNVPIWRIAIPGVVNKPLNQYGNTPTIRACRYSNEHLGMDWREGDDPWVYYVKSTPPMTPSTDVMALEWGQPVPEGFEIDPDKVIKKKVKPPLEPILGETDWTFDELQTGRKAQGIDIGGGSNPFSDGAIPGVTDETKSSTDTTEGRHGEGIERTDSEDGDGPDTDNEDGANEPLSW